MDDYAVNKFMSEVFHANKRQKLLWENTFVNQRICFMQVWCKRRGPFLNFQLQIRLS